MPKLVILAGMVMLAGCTQQAWFGAAKSAECQQNGGTATSCAGSHSDAYRAMKREQNKAEK